MDSSVIGQTSQIESVVETLSSGIEETAQEHFVPTPGCSTGQLDDTGAPGPNWSVLPDTCVVLIASCLMPKERGKMGMTCQNWYRVIMSTPHLWRSAAMTFRGKDEDTNHVKYARAVGRFWKKLYIFSGVRLGLRVGKFQRSFTAMLQILYSQRLDKLKELTVAELQFQRHFRGFLEKTSGARTGVLRSLNRFLRVQSQLECLDLSYATLKLEEGVSLLQSASEKSQNKIKYLQMFEMFSRDAAISFSADFANVIGRFETLVDLTLNYGYVTDELLTRLGECCRESLEFIRIRTHRNDSFQHTVDALLWNRIRQQIPRLRVKFSMSDIMKTNDIRRLLAMSMPLESVHICGHDDNDFRPHRTTTHLARLYRDTLRKVVIDVNPVYRTYGQGLISLVTDCTLLQYVEIHGKVTWPTLRQIFEQIDEKYLKKNLRPALTNMKIEITCVGQEEHEALLLVVEEFRPRFQSCNLEYEVVIEQMLPLFVT